MSAVHLSQVKDPFPVADPSIRRNVDIIVPVYKCAELAGRCLESLAANLQEIADSHPRLLVIVDSPGEPDVEQMVRQIAARNASVTVLENETNIGFVRTANRGLEIALRAGRDALLINADTETFPGTLRHLIEAAYADPQVGFACPRSNNASICSLPHFFGGTIADPEEAHQRWKLLSRTMPAWHIVPTGVGFYLFIKHGILANFGFLDIGFGVGYEEENDLVCRANKAGYRTVLANHAFAYHVGSASFSVSSVDLDDHRLSNLKKMSDRHAEFVPLVQRYEASAHFRAEAMLGNLLTAAGGRSKILFDFSSIGPDYNGTVELSLAVLTEFHRRHASRYEINVICSSKAFKFHDMNRLDGVRRHDPGATIPERFMFGVNLGQPFSMHQVSLLEDLAVINVFGMLDTIAEDCGYLSITHRLESLWGHTACHANGLMFLGKFSEQMFLTRYGDVGHQGRYARLLPTRLAAYGKAPAGGPAEHVLILGNHFAHKASASTAAILRQAFPTIRFAVLGDRTGTERNIMHYRAGTLGQDAMESLFARASIVVLPSHVEGFGLGLMHALAARKVVVARDIPATREILATFKTLSGVFLYSDDGDIVRAMKAAMQEAHSAVDDSGADTWASWVDGFEEFCRRLAADENLFRRLVNRIAAGDLLRKADALDQLQTAGSDRSAQPANPGQVLRYEPPPGVFLDPEGRHWLPARHVDELLALDGEHFLYKAYVTVLNRLPDENGLETYQAKLAAGMHKIAILRALKNSPEGTQLPMLLVGYRAVVTRWGLRTLMGRLG